MRYKKYRGICLLRSKVCAWKDTGQILSHLTESKVLEHRRALMSRTLAQYAVVEHAAHVLYAIDWKEAKEVIAT